MNREADAIIAEENLDDSTPAVDPVETPQPTEGNEEQPKENEQPSEQEEQPKDPENQEDPKNDPTNDPQDDPKDDPKDDKPTQPEKSSTERVNEARSFIEGLNLTSDKVFKEDGTVRPWREVVPAGEFLAAQLDPVVVTDKDGKQHEFLLLSDVEKAFPEGFEAKNNIEQMKFERAILDNENTFKNAIRTYNDAESRYNQETAQISQSRASEQNLVNEYKAMAKQGLVPEVGDPKDPKFSESDAVKEMDRILTWMEKVNQENAKNGLGQITSLYVAKQLMDTEAAKEAKQDQAKQIDKDRKEVASLSPTPIGGEEKKPQPVNDIPMSRLADEIIASEGLR
jgi:hypothetical protein